MRGYLGSKTLVIARDGNLREFLLEFANKRRYGRFTLREFARDLLGQAYNNTFYLFRLAVLL
jgi:hypothetical protein